MSEQFSIGESCFSVHPAIYGAECKIIRGVTPRKVISRDGCPMTLACYEVEWANPALQYGLLVLPKYLRRKPRQTDHSQWADSKVKDLLRSIKKGEPA